MKQHSIRFHTPSSPLSTDSTGSTHLLLTDSSISNPLTCPTAQKSDPANTADKAAADQRAETGLSAPAHPRSSAAPLAEFLHATSNTRAKNCRRIMLYFCSSQIVVYSYSLKSNELHSLKILYLYKTISTEVRIHVVSPSSWEKRK